MTETEPHPSKPRQGLLLPFLIPIASLALISAALWGFSRILLAVSHGAAAVLALIALVAIVGVATLVASRRRVTGAALFSMLGAVVGIAMLAGGIAILAFPLQAEEGGGGEGQPFAVSIVAAPGAAADGFETTKVEVPSGVPITIDFDNQDPQVPHNVAIFDGEDDKAPSLFEGEIVNGPAPISYDIEPLEPGSYFFHCSVHPTTMTGTITATEGGGEGGGGGGAGGPITVVAKSLAFDTDTLQLAPDTATTITMDNQDAGVPHNIAIYEDDTLATPIFVGDLFTGPGTIDYEVPPIPAGTYYFHCDVHPNMAGDVIVGEGGGGGGGGGGATGPTGGTGATGPTGATGGGGGEVSTAIAAANLAFDTDALTFTAGETATLSFDNQDAGIPHNVAIYTDESAAESIFVGELITGPTSIDYEIPAMDAGTYFFRCDVHPTMAGSVTVT